MNECKWKGNVSVRISWMRAVGMQTEFVWMNASVLVTDRNVQMNASKRVADRIVWMNASGMVADIIIWMTAM